LATETTRKPVDELPPEGDAEEARALIEKHPVRLPTYRLERVAVSSLNVDYAPPYGEGYARPLSEGRLRQLRRDWDPLAVSPITLSRRRDGSLWVIDGNHRRVVAFDKGLQQLPAMVHSGLERATEADLYTKLGTVLGQTPWTRFQAKLIAGNPAALDIVKIAERFDLEVNANGHIDGRVQAVARLEWIYGRGGPDGLNWVLGFLTSAFNGERESLGEMQLEGSFGFYLRYGEKVQREEIARLLGASGLNAWHDRAASIYQRIDVGNRSNTFGMAIADLVNETWRKKGKKVKELLPAWIANLSVYNLPTYREVAFSTHVAALQRPDLDPAPQQLAFAP
jgi:hypothetical protein